MCVLCMLAFALKNIVLKVSFSKGFHRARAYKFVTSSRTARTFSMSIRVHFRKLMLCCWLRIKRNVLFTPTTAPPKARALVYGFSKCEFVFKSFSPTNITVSIKIYITSIVACTYTMHRMFFSLYRTNASFLYK